MQFENWKKQVRPSSRTMVAAIAVIGIVATYNWIVAPHSRYLMAAQEYQSVKGKLASKKQILTNKVKAKRKKLEGLQKKLHQIGTELFEPADAWKFLSRIQTLAEAQGCRVHSLEFPRPTAGPQNDRQNTTMYITANRATLTVLGGYRNIVGLINKLQNRLQRVRIDPLDIDLKDSSPGHLKAEMTITIYVICGEERNSNG